LALEKVEYSIEYKIELVDDNLELIEYELNKITDAAHEAAEAIASIGKQVEGIMEKDAITKGALVDTLFAADAEGKSTTGFKSKADVERLLSADVTEEEAKEILSGVTLTDAQKEKLKEYRISLLSTESELIEKRQEGMDWLNNAVDEWNEKISRGQEKIARKLSVLDNYKNIIDIVGKDNFGISDELMSKLEQSAVDSSKNSVKAA
jgi:hypothetical protein